MAQRHDAGARDLLSARLCRRGEKIFCSSAAPAYKIRSWRRTQQRPSADASLQAQTTCTMHHAHGTTR